MFLLIELGVSIGFAPLVAVLASFLFWGFVIRKLRRYRIVQIVFLVDDHSVLRDE